MTKVIISKEHYDALIEAASISDVLNDVYDDCKKERSRLSDEIQMLKMNMKQFWMKRFAKVRLNRLEDSHQGWRHTTDVIQSVFSSKIYRFSLMESKYPCEPLAESSNQTASDNPEEPSGP
jgi:hypothetical protein